MRLHHIYAILLAGVATFPSYSAIAPTDSIQHLDECVVTGTLAPRTLKSVPVMTQLITRQDIDRLNPRSINDILQMSIPGIQISMHGAQTRITVQGMLGDHVLFLLDGEPINSEGNGAVDLNRIDIASIERIEILRGSASALYGSNAIGGVINFISKNVHKKLSATISGDYGSEGAQRYHGLLGLRFGDLSSQTTLNFNHATGYKIKTEGEPFVVYGGKTWNVGEKLRYRSVDNRWDATLYGYGSYRMQDWDDKINNHYLSTDFGGRVSYAPNARHSIFASYNHSGYTHSYYYYTATKDQYLPLFELGTNRARGQYNFGQDGRDRVLVNAGVDAVWESVSGDRINAEGNVYSSSTIALYGQAEWRIKPSLSATIGFREDFHSEFGSHFTPRLTMLYKQTKWRIRASYSEGFRSPSTKELHMDWDHNGMFRIKGNPELKPEVSRMISLAPEIQIGNNLNLTLQATYNRITNKIFNREEENGRVRRFFNARGISELWQTQLSLRWQIIKQLRLNLDYAYIRDLLKVKNKAGQEMLAVPTRPHNMTATLSYVHRWQDWGLSVDASTRLSAAVSTALFDQNLGDYTLVTYEPYNIVRLGASLDWRHKIKLTMGGDNLLNFIPKSVNASSSVSPGRTLFASLAVYL